MKKKFNYETNELLRSTKRHIDNTAKRCREEVIEFQESETKKELQKLMIEVREREELLEYLEDRKKRLKEKK